MRFRSAVITAHFWLGLLAAPVLAIVGLTGALLVLEDPVLDRLDAAISVVDARGSRQPVDSLLAAVRRQYAGAEPVAVQLPPDARHATALMVRSSPNDDVLTVFVDPYTARVLGTDADQHRVFQRVRQLHRQLLVGQRGSLVVVGAALALVLLAVTGPFAWWPRRRTRVRWTLTGWRRTLDLHATLGALTWMVLFAFGITGLVVHWDDATQRLIGWVTGAPAPHPIAARTATSCAASAVLSADRLVAAGARAIPGARPTFVQFPADDHPFARVSLKYPEDRTPNGRSIALIDACTGVPALTISTRAAPISYLIPREWNREIHTGDIFGWPTRALAFVFSLSLPVLAITGPLVWVGRRRRSTRGRSIGPRVATGHGVRDLDPARSG